LLLMQLLVGYEWLMSGLTKIGPGRVPERTGRVPDQAAG